MPGDQRQLLLPLVLPHQKMLPRIVVARQHHFVCGTLTKNQFVGPSASPRQYSALKCSQVLGPIGIRVCSDKPVDQRFRIHIWRLIEPGADLFPRFGEWIFAKSAKVGGMLFCVDVLAELRRYDAWFSRIPTTGRQRCIVSILDRLYRECGQQVSLASLESLQATESDPDCW